MVGIPTNAQTLPSAATAHCGKAQSKDALPIGTEFMPAANGLSETVGNPISECECELT
jgi:hypothetical protein